MNPDTPSGFALALPAVPSPPWTHQVLEHIPMCTRAIRSPVQDSWATKSWPLQAEATSFPGGLISSGFVEQAPYQAYDCHRYSPICNMLCVLFN